MAPTSFVGGDGPLQLNHRFVVGLRNPGRCPSSYQGIYASWQRPTATGGWEDVPIDCMTEQVLAPGQSQTICDSAGMLVVIPPRGSVSLVKPVPKGLAPGHYRLEVTYDWSTPPSYHEVDVEA